MEPLFEKHQANEQNSFCHDLSRCLMDDDTFIGLPLTSVRMLFSWREEAMEVDGQLAE